MTDVWRSLGWTLRGLAVIEGWRVKAVVLGLAPAEVDELWAEVIADQVRWPWAFSALREADRRLMLRCAELRERPALVLRESAERILGSIGLPFTPATVDEYGWMLEKMASE